MYKKGKINTLTTVLILIVLLSCVIPVISAKKGTNPNSQQHKSEQKGSKTNNGHDDNNPGTNPTANRNKLNKMEKKSKPTQATSQNTEEWHVTYTYHLTDARPRLSIYYGEDVRAEYYGESHYKTKIREGDVMQVENSKGYVEIYSVNTGELLDTKPFIVLKKITDAGMDAGELTAEGFYDLGGPFTSNWQDPNIEYLYWTWKIPGVYHHIVKNISGELSYGYKIPSQYEETLP